MLKIWELCNSNKMLCNILNFYWTYLSQNIFILAKE